MSSAATRLLKRRWAVPDMATPVVDRFFDAWAAGHTSIDLAPEEVTLLATCTAVSDGHRKTPLVLRGRRLQSWRLDQAESRVAGRLRKLVTADRITDGVDPEAMDTLFPGAESAQRRVAMVGVQREFALGLKWPRETRGRCIGYSDGIEQRVSAVFMTETRCPTTSLWWTKRRCLT